MYFEDYDNAGAQERNGEDVFSKPVRAGKRTYFFDVKATKGNDYYLTITESKRRVEKMEDLSMTNIKFSSTKKILRNSQTDLKR